MRHPIRSQGGGALLVVMVLLGLGALISAALLQVTSYSHRRSQEILAQRQADYSAMAGIETALADIWEDPEHFLREGTTWEPLEGSPENLDFRVELIERDGVYHLISSGGPESHQVAYTLKLKKSGHLTDYAFALGGSGEIGINVEPSGKQIKVFGAPVYIEGDLYINHNKKKDYAIYDEGEGFPVFVTGRAYIGQNKNHERDLTADDLNASQLIVGAPPLGAGQLLDNAVAYLLGLPNRVNHPDGPVLEYNPNAWGLYQNPSPRVVVVNGSLACDKDDWGDVRNGEAKFYGTLIVKGTLCQPSSMKGLEIHGALLAGGLEINSKHEPVTIYYDRTYIPPIMDSIPGSGSGRIYLVGTEAKH